MKFTKPLFLVFALLVGSSMASAVDKESAEERLERASVFAFGGIGLAGMSAPGEVALREVLRDPNAISLCQRVFVKGTVEAKCYALVALRDLAPDSFLDRSAEFEKHFPQHVHLMSGCLASRESGSVVLKAIKEGKYSNYTKPKKA